MKKEEIKTKKQADDKKQTNCSKFESQTSIEITGGKTQGKFERKFSYSVYFIFMQCFYHYIEIVFLDRSNLYMYRKVELKVGVKQIA